MAPKWTKVNKRLAETRREPYASVITYIKTKLRFALLRGTLPLLQYKAFEANEAMFTSRTLHTLTSV